MLATEDKPVGKDAIQRTPDVKVEVHRWNWNKGRHTETWYLQSYIQDVSWQKTIKNPAGNCNITTLPQYADYHFFEQFQPLDVVRVLEFDQLKWQGFLKRVQFGGWIDEQGNPHRTVTLQATSFGAYLTEIVASIDISIFEQDSDFFGTALQLAQDMEDAGESGLTFAEAITTVVKAWFNFLDTAIGSSKQTDYMNSYVDFTTGVSGNAAPGLPKEVFLFYGNEEEVNLWQVLQKLAEAPLNEFFFDEGPRKVWIDGKNVDLPRDKTYLIGRETPFDGSLNNATGAKEDRFKSMPFKTIPLSHLLRFDLNKSMEEVYSIHIVSPAIVDLSKLDLLATGHYVIDQPNFEKYSYRPNQHSLFYMQMAKKDDTAKVEEAPKISRRAGWVAQTLKNWYEHNDRFASGVISYMVPSNVELDPRIGDKIAIEGLDAYFYVEGVSHQWNYGGPLQGSASVTRGWKKTGGEIELKSKIFKRGKYIF